MAGAADFNQLKYEQEEKKLEVEASKIARGGSVYFLCMALVAMYVWILRQRSNKEHVAKKVETLGRASLEGKFDLVQVFTITNCLFDKEMRIQQNLFRPKMEKHFQLMIFLENGLLSTLASLVVLMFVLSS